MKNTKRHPIGLPYLFFTEMWERFGFYIVQGLLVLYTTKGFGFSDDEAYTIAGIFSALAYIAPMIGGLIADKLLGFKTCILWGGIFLILGYAILAITDIQGFYFGLATIIIGNGLFKPNVSSLLGALYPPGDTARDAGFTIFYIGINIGVLLSGLSGTIQQSFGWHAPFAFASFGLFIGVLTFLFALKTEKFTSAPDIAPTKHFFLQKPFLIFYCLVTIVLLGLILQSHLLGKWLLPVVGIFLLFFLFKLAFDQTPEYRNRLITLNILIISSIVFWMIFLQLFFSANLFIDRLVDKKIINLEVPTTIFYTLESIFVILLGPLFAWGWQRLTLTKRNPSPLFKFVAAIFFVGLGFLTLAISTYFPNEMQLVNPLWIVVSYFLITVGELLLSPIGLSAVTLLSPPHLVGLMMGIWFVGLGFGGQFAGFLAKLSSVSETAIDSISQLPVYRDAFFDYSYIAFGVAILLLVISWIVKKKWAIK